MRKASGLGFDSCCIWIISRSGSTCFTTPRSKVLSKGAAGMVVPKWLWSHPSRVQRYVSGCCLGTSVERLNDAQRGPFTLSLQTGKTNCQRRQTEIVHALRASGALTDFPTPDPLTRPHGQKGTYLSSTVSVPATPCTCWFRVIVGLRALARLSGPRGLEDSMGGLASAALTDASYTRAHPFSPETS